MIATLLLIFCTVAPPDGTLIFWDGGLLVRPIERHTGSTLTHVAIVLDGYVYEATWPRVQRTPYTAYIAGLQHKAELPYWRRRNFSWVHIPPPKYTSEQVAAMRAYAVSQLGRPYMLRGYLFNREVRGLHCSQYVGNMLDRAGVIQSENFNETPVSLYRKMTCSN
jgi:hypothetical protein